MKKIRFNIILIILLLTNCISILNAEEKNYKIIKLVNDQIITNYDLEQRLKLFSVLNNVAIDQENIDGYGKQMLSLMVDEKLQLEQIILYKIFIKDSEVNDYIARIYLNKDNDINSLLINLKNKNIDIKILEETIKMRLGWYNLSNRLYLRDSEINKIELESTMSQNPSLSEVQAKNIILQKQIDLRAKKFLRDKYTNKRLMNSKELMKMLGTNYKNPNVNLDIDFSVSRGGYRLKPHRDDVTRLYNFLIYLNNIPKKNGGSLTIFKKKTDKEIRKIFKRFPKITQLSKVKEFTPSSGSVIFFQSTPNSYHGVKLFRETNGKKRFFIYGSYALSSPVVWRYKNVSYVPFIKKTNKKMLTSGHDSDYLLRKAS